MANEALTTITATVMVTLTFACFVIIGQIQYYNFKKSRKAKGKHANQIEKG